MSVKDILNSYGIQMRNEIVTLRSGTKVVDKVFSGGQFLEPFFNLSYNDPDSLSNDILTMVNYVLGGNDPPLNEIDNTFGGIDSNAIIYDDAVRFHELGTGKILQTVPINDFQTIANAWNDFLTQQPLDGANV
ncbi:hypothetical protein HDF18_08460 [Mucilaginibacter sp. X5P1]|uniref:hypothetical protein n=1 Tax=Mucilaginibacter sp. X5P1 TaxID=2723088 RepID=UPI00161DAAF3|nr:hypothetical protein [Mucilaginibacter sp. X5P1]MBB6137689.1 hypothetical protein [Mucilaginibacter sp. X5P1]